MNEKQERIMQSNGEKLLHWNEVQIKINKLKKYDDTLKQKVSSSPLLSFFPYRQPEKVPER